MADQTARAAGPFVFNQKPVLWWPAEIRVPADGGETVAHRAHWRLEYQGAAAFDDADQAARHLGAGAWGTADDPLAAIVHDWSGIAQADDAGGVADIPCTDATKPLVLAHEAARQSIWRALFEMVTGAPAKNGATPPAPGPAGGEAQGGGESQGQTEESQTAKSQAAESQTGKGQAGEESTPAA